MYKRDLITVEIQRLAEVLAKILGLKLEGDSENAAVLYEQTLESAFGLPPEIWKEDTLENFETAIISQAYPAEKLDMLSQFLYSSLHDSDEPLYKKSISKKLLFIFDVLEKQHRIISLDNLNRQKMLLQYV